MSTTPIKKTIGYHEQESFRGGTEIIVHTLETLNEEARFACELMRHLSIVAGCPDGTDCYGKQKFRLMTPEEVVQRATEIASISFAEFRKRGLAVDLPAPKSPTTKELAA